MTPEDTFRLPSKSVSFPAQTPGLNDSTVAEAIHLRHDTWAKSLPKEPADLWDTLADWDVSRRAELFAHCVSLSVNAVFESYHRRPRALAHADRLAQSLELDMAAEGWAPTVDTYLGRVTKARILEAVREAKGQRAGDRLAQLKKAEMAAEAETLLAGSGWLVKPSAAASCPCATATWSPICGATLKIGWSVPSATPNPYVQAGMK